ncbi:MAG: RsmD family RNA methyltransferase [Synergistaceae bacterium]|nr:RsmD family RNA methyltransferase [Synergistaceae bacterium]
MKDIRPTSGRVMSALFSILGDVVDGAEFLDLFAGTGRVGIEALRRGAKRAVFVETVRNRADDIKRSLKDSDSNIVLSLEIRRALSWLVKHDMRFTIIFADPPYNSGWSETLPALPNLDAVFSPGALMVIEHSAREPVTLISNPHNLAITSTREYGETCLTFLQML